MQAQAAQWLRLAAGVRYNARHGKQVGSSMATADLAGQVPQQPSDLPAHLRPRWQAWLAGDRAAAALLALAIAACVAPLWVSALLPMMDLPQHLATVRILHSYADPQFAVNKYHVIDYSRTQYLSWYFAVDFLTYVMPLEVANRLVLSFYAVGLPLSLVALLRAHRRDPLLALLAVPLVYNVFFFMGFANYITALPLMFWGLALLRRSLDEATWPRVIGMAAIALVLFYSHAQPFLLYGLLAGLTVLLGARGWHPRHWWRSAAHLLPALLAMGVWTSRSLILAGEQEWKQGHGGRNVTSAQVNFEPWGERLQNLWTWWLDAYRGDSDEILAAAWIAVLAVAALLARRSEEDETPWQRAKIPAAMLVATLAVYLLSPVSYKWIWPISYRFVPVVAMLALVAVPAQRWAFGRWGRYLLFALPALALCGASLRLHVQKAKEFSDEAGPIRQVVAQADYGKCLISLVYGAGSDVINQAPLLHLGQYYVVDRGGMASFSFANFPQSPVLYPDVGGPPTFPARFEWTPERFTWAEYGKYFDYFLIRGTGDPFGRDRDKVELVTEQGPYRLFKKKPGA